MMNLPSRKRLRHAGRGAALVEAVVVISMMMVFLGATRYIHRYYSAKIGHQMSTRAEVLSYASHNCEQKPPSEMSNQLGAEPGGGLTLGSDTADPNAGERDVLAGPAAKLGAKGANDVQSGTKHDWNHAESYRTKTVSAGVRFNGKDGTLSGTFRARSKVTCNEKRFDNDWKAMLGMAAELAKGGRGFFD